MNVTWVLIKGYTGRYLGLDRWLLHTCKGRRLGGEEQLVQTTKKHDKKGVGLIMFTLFLSLMIKNIIYRNIVYNNYFVYLQQKME